jgi:long-chain acyl-CoA synthetase
LKKKELAFETHDNDFDMKLKVVGICSINREEWLLTDLACNLLGITSVPLYETLGDEILQIILS